jgi:hypothetical protein
VRQQPRHALQKARIVIDHDHDCLLRCQIRVRCPSFEFRAVGRYTRSRRILGFRKRRQL